MKRKAKPMPGRSAKQSARWVRFYGKVRKLQEEISQAGGDILTSRNFRDTRKHIQHGSMTVHTHCRNVALYSLLLCDLLKVRCSRRELIRGALLHDYFLYDWHIPDPVHPHRLHGFYHPGRALKNALRDYELSRIERDIIKKHMWPMTIFPPLCREAWIVTAADKWCSLLETLLIKKGHGALLSCFEETEEER